MRLAIGALATAAILAAASWMQFRTANPVDLVIGTGPIGGAYQAMAEGIAECVHRMDPNIRIQLTTDSAGSLHNMQRLRDREVDLAIVQNDTDPHEVQAQTLLPLHRGIFHFLVPMDSTIQSIYDLRGKTVGVGSENSGNYQIVHQVLGHFGIWEEASEFTPIYEPVFDCGEKLERGEIDAALVVTALTSPALTALVKRGHVKYVSLAESGAGNAVDGFAATYPYIEPFTIPTFVYPVHDAEQPAFRGRPIKPCESFAVRSTLVCRRDLPYDVARTIVAAIVTHRAEIMRQHPEARDIREHFEPTEVHYPIHDGAMAFYQRQQPTLIERYAEPMAFLLSLFLAFCGFLAGIRQWLTMRKKNRIDGYYVRLDGLLAELNGVRMTRQRLDSIEEELLTMRHDAVRELVNERLLADESFQIFQALLTDCHHHVDLERQSLGGGNVERRQEAATSEKRTGDD